MVLRRIAVTLLMLAMAGFLVTWGMGRPIPMDSDAGYYAQVALSLRGEPAGEASLGAAQTRCGSLLRTNNTAAFGDKIDRYLTKNPQAAARAADPLYTTARGVGQQPSEWLGRCTAYLTDHPFCEDPRYFHIFESRPLFPAVALAFTDAIGLEASLRLVAALGAALAGILLAVTGRLCGLSWPAALASQGALYLSLFGYWATRPFADGLAAALTAALILGVCLAARRRSPRLAVVLEVVGAALLIPARSHVAVLAGATLLLVLLVSKLIHRDLRLCTMLPGPLVALVGGLAVPALAGWASVTDSLQDLATEHFERRDAANPWKMYLYALRKYLIETYRNPAMIGWTVLVIAVVAAAVIIIRKPEIWAAILVPVAAGLGSVLAHPVIGAPASRLFSAAWPGIILAAAILADLIVRRGWRAFSARRTIG